MSTWVPRIHAAVLGRGVLSLTVCATLSLALVSCGGGDADKDQASDVDIFELQDSTNDLLDTARSGAPDRLRGSAGQRPTRGRGQSNRPRH